MQVTTRKGRREATTPMIPRRMPWVSCNVRVLWLMCRWCGVVDGMIKSDEMRLSLRCWALKKHVVCAQLGPSLAMFLSVGALGLGCSKDRAASPSFRPNGSRRATTVFRIAFSFQGFCSQVFFLFGTFVIKPRAAAPCFATGTLGCLEYSVWNIETILKFVWRGSYLYICHAQVVVSRAPQLQALGHSIRVGRKSSRQG